MSKVFKMSGVVIALSSIIALYGNGVNLLSGIFSFLFAIVLGLAIYTIGELLERVDHLEAVLMSSLAEARSDRRLQQVNCPQCGTTHDFDYPKCPNCKRVY